MALGVLVHPSKAGRRGRPSRRPGPTAVLAAPRTLDGDGDLRITDRTRDSIITCSTGRPPFRSTSRSTAQASNARCSAIPPRVLVDPRPSGGASQLGSSMAVMAATDRGGHRQSGGRRLLHCRVIDRTPPAAPRAQLVDRRGDNPRPPPHRAPRNCRRHHSSRAPDRDRTAPRREHHDRPWSPAATSSPRHPPASATPPRRGHHMGGPATSPAHLQPSPPDETSAAAQSSDRQAHDAGAAARIDPAAASPRPGVGAPRPHPHPAPRPTAGELGRWSRRLPDPHHDHRGELGRWSAASPTRTTNRRSGDHPRAAARSGHGPARPARPAHLDRGQHPSTPR